MYLWPLLLRNCLLPYLGQLSFLELGLQRRLLHQRGRWFSRSTQTVFTQGSGEIRNAMIGERFLAESAMDSAARLSSGVLQLISFSCSVRLRGTPTKDRVGFFAKTSQLAHGWQFIAEVVNASLRCQWELETWLCALANSQAFHAHLHDSASFLEGLLDAFFPVWTSGVWRWFSYERSHVTADRAGCEDSVLSSAHEHWSPLRQRRRACTATDRWQPWYSVVTALFIAKRDRRESGFDCWQGCGGLFVGISFAVLGSVCVSEWGATGFEVDIEKKSFNAATITQQTARKTLVIHDRSLKHE